MVTPPRSPKPQSRCSRCRVVETPLGRHPLDDGATAGSSDRGTRQPIAAATSASEPAAASPAAIRGSAHDIRQHIARSLNDCARETEDGFSAPVRDRPRLPLARARRRERSRGGDGSAGQGWRVLSASARNPDRSLQPGRASMDTSTCKHWRGADRRALVMARLAVARIDAQPSLVAGRCREQEAVEASGKRLPAALARRVGGVHGHRAPGRGCASACWSAPTKASGCEACTPSPDERGSVDGFDVRRLKAQYLGRTGRPWPTSPDRLPGQRREALPDEARRALGHLSRLAADINGESEFVDIASRGQSWASSATHPAFCSSRQSRTFIRSARQGSGPSSKAQSVRARSSTRRMATTPTASREDWRRRPTAGWTGQSPLEEATPWTPR